MERVLKGCEMKPWHLQKRVNIDWRINLQLVIQHYFQKGKECAFSLGKENFVDERIGLVIPLKNPYLDLINERIKGMFQMGFTEKWHQNLPSMNKYNGKSLQRQITNHKVNLEDMQRCFLVLLFCNLNNFQSINQDFNLFRF